MESVSVYVPCYNAENFIVRAVRSLLDQTVRADEVLVINDGCTDRSMDLISTYPVKIISMGSNQGLAAARNRAYQEARNELIACIDADCEATPTWLEQLLRDFPADCAGTGGKTVEANQVEHADRWRARHMPLHWGDKQVMNPKVIYGGESVVQKKRHNEGRTSRYHAGCRRLQSWLRGSGTGAKALQDRIQAILQSKGNCLSLTS